MMAYNGSSGLAEGQVGHLSGCLCLHVNENKDGLFIFAGE